MDQHALALAINPLKVNHVSIFVLKAASVPMDMSKTLTETASPSNIVTNAPEMNTILNVGLPANAIATAPIQCTALQFVRKDAFVTKDSFELEMARNASQLRSALNIVVIMQYTTPADRLAPRHAQILSRTRCASKCAFLAVSVKKDTSGIRTVNAFYWMTARNVLKMSTLLNVELFVKAIVTILTLKSALIFASLVADALASREPSDKAADAFQPKNARTPKPAVKMPLTLNVAQRVR